ncbi:hypothetical protein [Streptomyces sp. HD]|uniref:hypothetical protein n=1 Tax=Streptomyces sp. HD TaxID=3020892 RepID=UPI002330E2EB|nr:hypothetical protein [Streptomyces sp. HD]MDC0767727.1 hypothetical protein [Streptomyces sp. HD]
MWEGLDAVDWAGLEHNYGPAQDVPGLLGRCAGPDRRDAEEAADDLRNLLFHQGGWICPAAPAALPFLLRLGARADVLCRRSVLDLVAVLAAEAGRVAEKYLAPGWAAAWERALPEVLALLAAPEAEVRRAAADTLADCTSPGELILPALLDHWRTESDLATRLDLVVALGAASRREPAGPRTAEAVELLRALLDDPEPQLCLAAVRSTASRDPGLAERRVDLLLAAVRDPGVDVWRHTSVLGGGVRAVQNWAGALLADSPATHTSYVLRLLADPPQSRTDRTGGAPLADERRIGALAQAGELLHRWRSPVDALLPAVAARLDDPNIEVRFRATELLACVGPAAAVHADAVAGLVDDTGRRGTRAGETVADASLWALARMNDERCVPGLVERLAGAPSTFSKYGIHAGGKHHFPSLPALHEVLALLPDHAGALLPAVRDRLGATRDEHEAARLCEVLAAWGHRARTAVPALVTLLERDADWVAAATALGGIGVEHAGARDVLLARSTADDANAPLAAWAYWRTGGEPERALEVLGPAATQDGHRHPHLRKLADFGPHATGLADGLRALARSKNEWTSVEAAHALWAATGETEIPVRALLRAVRSLADGHYVPVMLTAVRHLTRIGPAARPAGRLLRGVPDLDRRLYYFSGWRGFETDESIRTAVDDLLVVAD